MVYALHANAEAKDKYSSKSDDRLLSRFADCIIDADLDRLMGTYTVLIAVRDAVTCDTRVMYVDRVTYT